MSVTTPDSYQTASNFDGGQREGTGTATYSKSRQRFFQPDATYRTMPDEEASATNRRTTFSVILAFMLVLALICSSIAASLLVFQSEPARSFAWSQMKSRYFASTATQAETGIDSVLSSSESRSLALVMAALKNDSVLFSRIWGDIQAAHQRRRFGSPLTCLPGSIEIAPTNCAQTSLLSNLLATWGITIAAERWERPDYWAAATELRYALETTYLAKIGDQTVLLPEAEGFERGDGALIQTSSLALPALKAFAKADPSGPWDAAYRDTRFLLHEWLMLRNLLPAEWMFVSTDGHLSLAKSQPPKFTEKTALLGLFLAWNDDETSVLQRRFTRLWNSAIQDPANGFQGHALGLLPAEINVTNLRVSQSLASSGTMEIWRYLNNQVPSHGSDWQSGYPKDLTTSAIREFSRLTSHRASIPPG